MQFPKFVKPKIFYLEDNLELISILEKSKYYLWTGNGKRNRNLLDINEKKNSSVMLLNASSRI